MKKLLIILWILSTVSACNKDEIDTIQEDSIFGTWHLTGSLEGDYSGFAEWKEVNSSYKIKFEHDFSFLDNLGSKCPSNPEYIPTFELIEENEKKIIDITYQCDEGEFPEVVQRSYYRFSGKYLILSPVNQCTEGCSYRYERISDSDLMAT